MQKINYSNFADFFQTKIAPELQPFEAERLKLLKVTKPLQTIFWILIAVVAVCYLINASVIFNISLVIAIICLVISGIKTSKYKTKIKNTFYSKVYTLLGLNHTNSSNAQIDIRNKIVTICKKTGIYPRYDTIIPDDVISGDYNGLPFVLSDVDIHYETGSGKNRHTVTVLHGLFLAIKIEKNYKGETIIKTDQFMQAKEIKGKKAVKLEDVEFEKAFEVYGTDQIESRYLLTTAFMRRLLDYKKQKRCGIEVVFSKETGLKENMFFFIHTHKDHFELPINVSLLNQDLFYKLVKEIVDIMDIVETLKLDQNIGM